MAAAAPTLTGAPRSLLLAPPFIVSLQAHLVVEARDLAEIRHFCNHKLGIRWGAGQGQGRQWQRDLTWAVVHCGVQPALTTGGPGV